MTIYQNNIYRKDLGKLHLDHDERFQVNDSQSYVPVSVAYPNIQVAGRSTNPVIKAVFHPRSYSPYRLRRSYNLQSQQATSEVRNFMYKSRLQFSKRLL